MNSEKVAEKVWKKITNERYCPTDEELKDMVHRTAKKSPDFVAENALRRLRGHVATLRTIIDYEPKSEIEAEVRSQDLNDLSQRKFEEQLLLPVNPPKYFPFLE